MNPFVIAAAYFFLLDDKQGEVALKGVEWLRMATLAPFIWLSIGTIAFFSFLAVAAWSGSRSAERQAYYKNDLLKKLAESSTNGATAALEYLREQERQAIQRRRSGLQLGGLITAAVGIGLMIFFRGVAHNTHVYLMGTIPLLIGIVLAIYGYTFAPME